MMNLLHFILLNSFFLLAISCQKQSPADIPEPVNAGDITLSSCDNPPQSSDYREYQHGIDFIQKNDTVYYLIWGSSGNPPQGASASGSWTHDIYYSEVNIRDPKIRANTLISADEAQEPPSSAKCRSGNIFICMEDGNDVQNSVAERYAVYNSEMQPVKDYPNMVFDGGHSAHVAAVGNRFVVFWSNDWDDSVPGADGIGTGLDVLADVYSAEGSLLLRVDVATGDYRDWWPVVAGSDNYACLVWQRYAGGDKFSNLMYSILNPETGELLKSAVELEKEVKYYTYDVQYYPSVKRFVIAGTYYSGGGFAILLDEKGEVIDKRTGISGIVREAQGVALVSGGELQIAYAKQPSGVMLLKVSENEIRTASSIENDYNWFGTGTDGIPLNDTTLYMINLSPCGLVKRKIYLHK